MTSPSRRKGTLARATSSQVLLGLVLVEGVLLVPLYLRYIGDSLYGAWLASGTIVTYLGLANFGLNNVLVQKVAEAYGAKDRLLVGRYASSGLAVAFGLAVLPTVLALALAGFLPRFIDVSPEDVWTLQIAFLFAGIATSLMIAMYAVGGVLAALQRQTTNGVIQVTSAVAGILGTVGLLLAGFGLLAIPVGVLIRASLAFLLEGLALWYFGRRVFVAGSLRPGRPAIIELAKPSSAVFLAQAGTTVARQSDNLLVSVTLGPQAVVIYALSKRAIDLISMLVGQFAHAFTPALAHLYGELGERQQTARQLTKSVVHVTVVMAVVCIGGYMVFNRAFVDLWVGNSRYAGDLVVFLLSIHGLLYALSVALYSVVFAKGYLVWAAVATGSEGALRLVLAVVFATWIGLIGVALAAITALALTGFWILILAYREAVGISISELRIGLASLATVILGVATISVLFHQALQPETTAALVAQIAVYLAVASLWTITVDRQIRHLAAAVLRGQSLVHRIPDCTK